MEISEIFGNRFENDDQDKINSMIKVLEETLDDMIRQGMLPQLSQEEKKDILKEVVGELVKNFGVDCGTENLRSEQFRKTVVNSLVLSAANVKDPTFKFDLGILFDKDVTEEKLGTELKKAFNKLLKLEPSKEQTKALENDIDLICAHLAKEMKNDMENSDEMAAKNENSLSLLSVMTAMFSLILSPKGDKSEPDEALMQFYGHDPRIPGAVSAVIGEVAANVPDWADVGQDFATASVASQFRSTAGDDPSGLRMLSEQRMLGMSGLSQDFLTECLNEGLVSSAPRLEPGGANKNHH